MYVTRKEQDDRDQSIPYCRAYRQMIFESKKVTLEAGIPS